MNQEPFLTISLRDGSQAALGDERMRVGEREFAVADIQDARQVAPDPQTIALRVAGARHGVELQPTQPEEGTLLLEAIFRLRPALRPAGFDAPTTLPSGFPPLPASATNPPALGQPWTAQSGWSPNPGLYAPPPGKSAPMPSQGYGSYAPSAGARSGLAGGRLTPLPRTGADLIGAAFELFVAHWRIWLLLGLAALLIPEIVHGAADAVFQVVGGKDLWAGVPPTTNGSGSGALGVGESALPPSRDLALLVLELLVGGAIGALVGGWAAAVLGIAGRNALFGRAPQIGADLRAGLRRVLPTTGANILSILAPLAIMLPVIILYGIMLTQFRGALVNPTSIDPTSTMGEIFATLGCLALILLLPCGILAIHVFVRLMLAPYIAATEPLGPVAALRKSWEITRRQWWHTAVPIFAVGLFVAVISIPASLVQSASFGVSALIAVPLVAALTAPLAALVAVVVLYDLRLRREGYAALVSEDAAARAVDEPEPNSV